MTQVDEVLVEILGSLSIRSDIHPMDFDRRAAAILTALSEKGMVIVPSSKELEFARTREGAILVGYNPRSEEGGWVCVGNVTTAVTKIEAERNEALDSLAKAKQRIAAVRIATGDLSASDGEAK